MPKTEDKGHDKKMKDIAKCFKIVQALFVTVMFTFDQERFAEVLMKPQESQEEAKSKKKKKGAKQDEISILTKFVENLNLKIFEEKYEASPE